MIVKLEHVHQDREEHKKIFENKPPSMLMLSLDIQILRCEFLSHFSPKRTFPRISARRTVGEKEMVLARNAQDWSKPESTPSENPKPMRDLSHTVNSCFLVPLLGGIGRI